MCVGGVPGDDHIVPLVIVQGVVAVSLQQTWPIAQVKDVVDESVSGATATAHELVCTHCRSFIIQAHWNFHDYSPML